MHIILCDNLNLQQLSTTIISIVRTSPFIVLENNGRVKNPYILFINNNFDNHCVKCCQLNLTCN